MTSEKQLQEQKDKELWELAKRRADFKNHLLSYVVVNSFLWLFWYFMANDRVNGYPWPLFASLVWGIGLVFHFLGVYAFPGTDLVEREYRKLKEKQQ